MTFLRSKRSAITPEAGPRKNPGTMRAAMTTPTAASGEPRRCAWRGPRWRGSRASRRWPRRLGSARGGRTAASRTSGRGSPGRSSSSATGVVRSVGASDPVSSGVRSSLSRLLASSPPRRGLLRTGLLRRGLLGRRLLLRGLPRATAILALLTGPASRRIWSSSAARSMVTFSTVSPLRSDALVSPSVT